MAEERIILDGYKIIQSVEIYGMEIVVAENTKAEQQFMTWRRSLDMPFDAEEYIIPVYGNDYLDIFREFIRCQSVYLDNLSLERKLKNPDYAVEAADCIPGSMDTDLKGKVVALKADILSPEYRTCSNQLVLATGGFGCSPSARGKAVFCTNLYSGEQERWSRSDILGVINERALPEWARERLSKVREPQEKESVVERIREAKASPAAPPKEPQTKKHDKSGPEL